jgi:hypothetical protein
MSIRKDELNYIKGLLKKNPTYNFLNETAVNERPFEQYSQIPELPDRENWWMALRKANGLALALWADLAAEMKASMQQTQEALDAIVAQLEKWVEEEERAAAMKGNPEDDTLKVHAYKFDDVGELDTDESVAIIDESRQVPRSSWDPFVDE